MIYKKYLDISGQTYEVKLYYTLGGWNHFTSQEERRGYYLSVTPVQVNFDDEGNVVSRTTRMFSGVKELLVEVNRKSKKREEEALEMITEERIEKLLQHIGVTA